MTSQQAMKIYIARKNQSTGVKSVEFQQTFCNTLGVNTLSLFVFHSRAATRMDRKSEAGVMKGKRADGGGGGGGGG